MNNGKAGVGLVHGGRKNSSIKGRARPNGTYVVVEALDPSDSILFASRMNTEGFLNITPRGPNGERVPTFRTHPPSEAWLKKLASLGSDDSKDPYTKDPDWWYISGHFSGCWWWFLNEERCNELRTEAGPSGRIKFLRGLGQKILDYGTVTTATPQTVVDDSKAWTVGEWVHSYVKIYDGTGLGQIKFISANTSTEITTDAKWEPIPDTTSLYSIHPAWNSRSNDDAGLFNHLFHEFDWRYGVVQVESVSEKEYLKPPKEPRPVHHSKSWYVRFGGPNVDETFFEAYKPRPGFSHDKAEIVIMEGCNTLVFANVRRYVRTLFPNAIILGHIYQTSANSVPMVKNFLDCFFRTYRTSQMPERAVNSWLDYAKRVKHSLSSKAFGMAALVKDELYGIDFDKGWTARVLARGYDEAVYRTFRTLRGGTEEILGRITVANSMVAQGRFVNGTGRSLGVHSCNDSDGYHQQVSSRSR